VRQQLKFGEVRVGVDGIGLRAEDTWAMSEQLTPGFVGLQTAAFYTTRSQCVWILRACPWTTSVDRLWFLCRLLAVSCLVSFLSVCVDLF